MPVRSCVSIPPDLHCVEQTVTRLTASHVVCHMSMAGADLEPHETMEHEERASEHEGMGVEDMQGVDSDDENDEDFVGPPTRVDSDDENDEDFVGPPTSKKQRLYKTRRAVAGAASKAAAGAAVDGTVHAQVMEGEELGEPDEVPGDGGGSGGQPIEAMPENMTQGQQQQQQQPQPQQQQQPQPIVVGARVEVLKKGVSLADFIPAVVLAVYAKKVQVEYDELYQGRKSSKKLQERKAKKRHAPTGTLLKLHTNGTLLLL
jgi:hypothetical protein